MQSPQHSEDLVPRVRRREGEDPLALKLRAKEARVARQAANKARRQLHGAGVEARKQERLRKKRAKAFLRAGNLIPADQDPILDPEADSEPGSEPGSDTELERQLGRQLEWELGRELE